MTSKNSNTAKMTIGKYITSGSICTVYETDDDKIVFKKYPSQAEADAAYHFACIGEENGIGPKVYELGYHGYFTEKVTVADYDDMGDYKLSDDHPLVQKVLELFGEDAVCDMQFYNLGIIDGKFVLIDFDPGLLKEQVLV